MTGRGSLVSMHTSVDMTATQHTDGLDINIVVFLTFC